MRLPIAIALLFFSACNITPAAQRAIAERRVNLTAWGIYCVPEFCGVGYLQYQRNPLENLDPAKPPIGE